MTRAPDEGGFHRVGHICAYQRGYYDAVEGRKQGSEYEKPGHKPAYEKGWSNGKAELTKAVRS